MSGLADSIWANAPSTTSASAGQGTSNHKSPREPKGAKGAPSRGATNNIPPRKRVRGGGKPKQGIDGDDTNSSSATAGSVASPANLPNATSTRPAPPSRTQSTQSTQLINAERKTPSGALPAKTTPTAQTTPPTSQASSAAPSKRNSNRKRGQPKRKGSLAISVVSNSSEQQLSTIIEPATPLSSSDSPVSSIPPTLSSIDTSLPNTAFPPRTPSPISSQAETLPPATPDTSILHPSTIDLLKPTSVAAVILNQSTNLRPSTPASHIDWADDDEEELPDLDDWGVTPTTATHNEEGGLQVQGSNIILAPQSPISDAKASDSEDADNQSVISVPASAVSASVKGSNGPPRVRLTDEQFAERKRLLKEKKKATKERKAAIARSSAGDLASRIGGLSVSEHTSTTAFPSKPSSVASISPNSKTSPLPANNLPTRPHNHRTNSRPSTPSSPLLPNKSLTASTSSPNPSSNPRRKPFGGQPSFGLPNRERGAPGSGGFAADRKRDRPTSSGGLPHARPVISANALSQLTKSLSGGTRAHGNANGAERSQTAAVVAE